MAEVSGPILTRLGFLKLAGAAALSPFIGTPGSEAQTPGVTEGQGYITALDEARQVVDEFVEQNPDIYANQSVLKNPQALADPVCRAAVFPVEVDALLLGRYAAAARAEFILFAEKLPELTDEQVLRRLWQKNGRIQGDFFADLNQTGWFILGIDPDYYPESLVRRWHRRRGSRFVEVGPPLGQGFSEEGRQAISELQAKYSLPLKFQPAFGDNYYGSFFGGTVALFEEKMKGDLDALARPDLLHYLVRMTLCHEIGHGLDVYVHGALLESLNKDVQLAELFRQRLAAFDLEAVARLLPSYVADVFSFERWDHPHPTQYLVEKGAAATPKGLIENSLNYPVEQLYKVVYDQGGDLMGGSLFKHSLSNYLQSIFPEDFQPAISSLLDGSWRDQLPIDKQASDPSALNLFEAAWKQARPESEKTLTVAGEDYFQLRSWFFDKRGVNFRDLAHLLAADAALLILDGSFRGKIDVNVLRELYWWSARSVAVEHFGDIGGLLLYLKAGLDDRIDSRGLLSAYSKANPKEAVYLSAVLDQLTEMEIDRLVQRASQRTFFRLSSVGGGQGLPAASFNRSLKVAAGNLKRSLWRA